jgi:hypothetical protein
MKTERGVIDYTVVSEYLERSEQDAHEEAIGSEGECARRRGLGPLSHGLETGILCSDSFLGLWSI